MRAILVGMLACASISGCGTSACKNNTLFVTFALSGLTGADGVDVTVTLDGGTGKTTHLALAAGLTRGSVEVDFPSGYPRGHVVAVRVDVKSGALLVATGNSTVALAHNCESVDVATKPASTADMAMPDLAPLPQGSVCTNSDTCASAGGCVDGYCCDTNCAGACIACNVSGKEGTCSSVGAGFKPATGHPSCGPDSTSSCMRDGACDGAGSCRIYAAGTICAGSTCSNGMYTPKSVCDGAGACKVPTTISCTPYVCQDATTCYSTCSSNSQCASPNTCANPGPSGSCGLKSLGAPCSADGQCSSNHCAPEGICCDQACAGQCQYCESGTGACKYTTGPPASPRPACTGQGNAPCGGSCGGSSTACVYPGNATSCGPAANCAQSGINSHYYSTPPGTCSGSGSCNQTVTDCGAYSCGGCLFGAGTWCCYTVCSSDANCNTTLGYHCNTSNSMCQ